MWCKVAMMCAYCSESVAGLNNRTNNIAYTIYPVASQSHHSTGARRRNAHNVHLYRDIFACILCLQLDAARRSVESDVAGNVQFCRREWFQEIVSGGGGSIGTVCMRILWALPNGNVLKIEGEDCEMNVSSRQLRVTRHASRNDAKHKNHATRSIW